MRSEIEALIQRVEAATGPDRELDAQLWLSLTPGATRKTTHVTHWLRPYDIDETRDETGRLIIVPAYTSSIDAAVALADRTLLSKSWTLGQNVHHLHWSASINKLDEEGRPDCMAYSGACRSPALALVAATLRALSQKEPRND